jgi:hypothetical protein
MNSIVRKVVLTSVAALVLLAPAAQLVLSAQEQQRPPLPNPVLSMTGVEYYETGGKQWKRYKYAVANADAYPKELFAAAPDLPPCGNNNNSSRTWVDIYSQDGKRLYGFCAFGKPGDLNNIWFALEVDAPPPSWIYIELNDRKTGLKYKSNLAETSE